jgi:hypothetical protein
LLFVNFFFEYPDVFDLYIDAQIVAKTAQLVTISGQVEAALNSSVNVAFYLASDTTPELQAPIECDYVSEVSTITCADVDVSSYPVGALCAVVANHSIPLVVSTPCSFTDFYVASRASSCLL